MQLVLLAVAAVMVLEHWARVYARTHSRPRSTLRTRTPTSTGRSGAPCAGENSKTAHCTRCSRVGSCHISVCCSRRPCSRPVGTRHIASRRSSRSRTCSWRCTTRTLSRRSRRVERRVACTTCRTRCVHTTSTCCSLRVRRSVDCTHSIRTHHRHRPCSPSLVSSKRLTSCAHLQRNANCPPLYTAGSMCVVCVNSVACNRNFFYFLLNARAQAPLASDHNRVSRD